MNFDAPSWVSSAVIVSNAKEQKEHDFQQASGDENEHTHKG